MGTASLRRRAALCALGAAGALLVSPAPALAHGIIGKPDLPVPRWLFAWAAAVVLIVSFVALSVMWRRPRLQNVIAHRVAGLPGLLRPACGAVGLFFFCLTVYAGLAGEQVLPPSNIAPTMVYALFWVGFAFASLFGDVFRAFNPWLAFAEGAAWLARKARIRRPFAVAPYPRWLGRWPAAAGVFAFAWMELIYVEKDTPRNLGIVALAYALLMLAGMAVYGIETWSYRGDAFSVYFNLFSRLSPLSWRRRQLDARTALSGIVDLELWPGTLALIIVMIGTITFDGLQQGPLYMNHIYPAVEEPLAGLGPTVAVELAGSIVMVGVVLLVGAAYRLGILGMSTVDRDTPQRVLALRFAHSLVPIALAYALAHYFSLLVYQVQAFYFLISDPLGNGANYFGTAGGMINFTFLTPNSIWYFQVAALLIGHVCALALAHDRAIALYRDPVQAVRSQYWMLVVMVFFTCLGLWLLSAAA
ncbi:MAG TPA: fenitrothion hydrolase [Solirubrobacteraceae bacterium]|nr:fenitrothion hydrolase [Solirubrobacteraceae bacterium]